MKTAQTVQGSNPPACRGFSVQSFLVLPVPAWVTQLPLTVKDMHARLTGISKLTEGVSVWHYDSWDEL